MTETTQTIRPAPFCERCRSTLIHKSKFKKTDPWRSLEITSMMVLIHNVMNEKNYLIKYGNEIHGISMIKCLGCFMPEMMKKIIEIAKEKNLEKLKILIPKTDDSSSL